MNFNGLSVIYINCTLKKSPEKSHTSTLIKLSQNILKNEGVKFEEIRFIDENVVILP
jgi:multimeric flavodoxin WrbA